MMRVRIYAPARSAMQSGSGRASGWRLEAFPEAPKRVDPLTGWIGSADMRNLIRLDFPTKEAAIAYAERNGLCYIIEATAPEAPRRAIAYSDNFRFNRRQSWTH
jgi:hypothetical protein